MEISRVWTVEDLDDPAITSNKVELWEGELIEMAPPFPDHNFVADLVFYVFQQFALKQTGLRCGGQTMGFVLSKHPAIFYCPDVSLFRNRPMVARTFFHFSPEVAVEVLSSSNSAGEMATKTKRYLAAGSEQVWIIDPEKRTLAIHFADGRLLHADGGKIACEGILAGLEFDLDFIFEKASEG